ncbi:MAG: hypothetical protein ACOYLU_15635, partial [Limisphaerales bacterium]
DAVRRLAERARIPLEMDNDPAARDQRSIKDQLLKLHEAITQRWQQCLAGEAAGQGPGTIWSAGGSTRMPFVNFESVRLPSPGMTR